MERFVDGPSARLPDRRRDLLARQNIVVRETCSGRRKSCESRLTQRNEPRRKSCDSWLADIAALDSLAGSSAAHQGGREPNCEPYREGFRCQEWKMGHASSMSAR